jgi:hypothetical protein
MPQLGFVLVVLMNIANLALPANQNAKLPKMVTRAPSVINTFANNRRSNPEDQIHQLNAKRLRN